MIAFQAIALFLGQQAQGKAIDALTMQIKELRDDAKQGGMQAVELRVKVDEHERRIQALEKK